MTAEQSQAIDQLAESFSEQTPEAAAPETSNEPSTAEVLKPILGMGFAILAPNWQVTENEAEQLAESYAALVDKYLPDGIGNYGVEINALMITGAIVLPRLKVPRKAEPAPEPTPEQGLNNGD